MVARTHHAFRPTIPEQIILDLAAVRFIPPLGGALVLDARGNSHVRVSIVVPADEN
jgi:hypothetical protein